MCDCGCANKSPSADRNYATTEMQSLPRERYRGKTKYRSRLPNAEINARRRLTYDDDDEDHHSSAVECPYPTEPQSNGGLDVLRWTRGLAIVQPETNMANATLDYAGAVRRQNSNGRSRVSQKFRAALPPRGRTPCDPNYQSSANSEVRRRYPTR